MRWLALIGLLGCAEPEPIVTDEAAVDGTSRCESRSSWVRCTHETTVLVVRGERREVHWQVPVGDAPETGWPAAILFQGSWVSAERSWSGDQAQPYGLLFQARTVEALLDAGYAVITPETHLDGTTYWDTNVAPWITDWERAPDHELMLRLFEEIDAGSFGTIDPSRLHAAGLSSGAYMASRAAIAYPGRFRTVAIVAGSFATCAGWFCAVPAALPAAHPPTLFLHGQLDTIVPVATMRPYAAQLARQGIDARVVVDPNVWHGWIPAAPPEVVAWFEAPR